MSHFYMKNLFKILLEKIDLSDNKFKKIEIDFRALSNVKSINLKGNDCINGVFDPKHITTGIVYYYVNAYPDLQVLQRER